jgi:hypothetical protein
MQERLIKILVVSLIVSGIGFAGTLPLIAVAKKQSLSRHKSQTNKLEVAQKN